LISSEYVRVCGNRSRYLKNTLLGLHEEYIHFSIVGIPASERIWETSFSDRFSSGLMICVDSNLREGYRIVPICSYAVYFFQKRSEYRDVLADVR